MEGSRQAGPARTAARILVVAYEFPPSPSPQSLRWAYLCRELANRGHEVHVLTVDLGGMTAGLPSLPDSLVLHRTYPGPIRGVVAKRRKRAAVRAASAPEAAGDENAAVPPSRLGWKYRAWLGLQRAFEWLLFPDLRGEWSYPARRALDRLLAELRPDVVISSHEPATSLQLGLLAKKAGYPLIADLGDPVLAPYTAPRWRRRALALESRICRLADQVLVTTHSTRALLHQRHGPGTRVSVISQGFDDARGWPATVHGKKSGEALEMLYTGSFYSFRRADELVRAVLAEQDVRLSIASISVPDEIVAAARAHPDRIRLLGFLPHTRAIELQRAADVLVHLPNRDPTQVPGKFYEYLGACRPILHTGPEVDDAAADLIRERRRGWVSAGGEHALRLTIAELRSRKAAGQLDEGLQLDLRSVAEFGWSALGDRLDGIIRATVPGLGIAN